MKPAQILSYNDSLIRNQISLKTEVSVGEQAVSEAKVAREEVRKLCSHAFPNLDDYKYVFFTAGATEAIDFLVTKQPTSAARNEYRYVFAHSTVSTDIGNRMHFMSYPFSGTGMREAIREDLPIILDASYIFCTEHPLSPAIPRNVEHVIFSLSKSHNIYDYRCGWFFTNTKFPGLYILQYEYGYLSSLIKNCVSTALQFSPNELRMRNAERISSSFEKAGLIEREVNLFGFTEDGTRIPYYQIQS